MTFRSEPLWEGESCTYRVGRHAWATKIDRFLKFSDDFDGPENSRQRSPLENHN